MTPEIDGDTRIVAILGDPIAQVKSPQLFNRRFAQRSLNAVLIPFHVTADKLSVVLDGLRAIANVAGVVVTVPHKVSAAKYAAALTPVARAVGAVNCLRREPDGAWTGAMFDGIGFVDGLAARGHTVRGRRILLVGAGGAGAAVAHALVERGAASLDVCDVRADSRQNLLHALRAYASNTAVREGEARASSTHDLIINATPCGMREGDPMPVDLGDARQGALVADLIMKPATTRLLAEAKTRGLATHEGRHLLEHSVGSIADFFRLTPACAGGGEKRGKNGENPIVTSGHAHYHRQ
ncbi:Shikimate 5-dehydrogenase I alpha [Paraburkholderia unamae]|uniref:shikimate dehydrogenase family protein n=1 Tax=Paraburkholderia unamae TaxID=219649 RepID=UPI001CAE2DEE|nr:shikimate dehydrogenase [Paraburkholderia unamae]CAG9271408.1 Shikimate 5-dehydrogenase I alpha [Paraburkholderia unamae]